MASIPTQGQGQSPGGGAQSSESSGAAEQAREKAGEVAGQAQEKAQELAGQATEQARQAAGQARNRMREQVDQRSTQAGQQVTSQASDIRTVAQQLREQGKDRPAQLAEQAADRAERVGSYLTESDADRILDDIEDFARQRPWAVVAGGMALGFVASRFLKASSQDRYYSRTPQQLPNTTTRPAGTTLPPRTGAPLRPTGDGIGSGDIGSTGVGAGATTETERTREATRGPADTPGGPPTSTGAL
ncbi:MAG TPA: hypothetical protein VGW75_09965 [Solirubrobacteraceae bacterium]|jgi:ElaB/YqjD/DUF883 family membrane-anchored ribosome-binding protein|nr:hypothetical protein [Solirubrobacteraceae bacterium]